MWDHALQLVQTFDFLVGPVFSGIGGVIAALVGRRLPHRWLWRLSDPSSVVYCISTSGHFDTGTYLRPMTGIGQVRAFSMISPSIKTAYRLAKTSSIVLSEDITPTHLTGDVITLGGAKNNAITKEILEKLYPKTRFRYVKDLSTMEFEGREYEAPVEPDDSSPGRKQLKKDYAVVINAASPFAEDRRVVVLAGAHTYGTEGAAKLFVERLRKRSWRLPQNYIAFAEVSLRERGILSVKLLRIKRI
jgi:hypothetical protein